MSMLKTRPRRIASVALAGALALSGFAAVQSQAVGAHETVANLNYTCGVAGALPIAFTVSHNPGTATAGAPLDVTVNAVASPSGFETVGVLSLTITVPIPTQVASATAMATGGNFTLGSYRTEGSNLIIVLNAGSGVTVGTMQIPELMIMTQLKSGIEGQTITFSGPSVLSIATNLLGVVDTCNANAGNPPLLSPTVAGGVTTTTGGQVTTTTGGQVTTTTHAHETTTSTLATTTTSRPATTTTRPATTTTRPATTTTRATSSTTGLDFFAALWKWLMCFLFGRC